MRVDKTVVRETGRSDAEIFRILEMRDRGMSCARIGALCGCTKSAIIGLIGRINREVAESDHDGTLPYGWWREGLSKRGENAS